MTHKEDIWECIECGQEQGRHNMYFDGICGDCDVKILTEEEKVQLENFISLKRLELKDSIQNINGSFCDIQIETCDADTIILSVVYGISDGYSRDFINGEIELDRETFEISYENYYTRVLQEYEKE